MEIAQVVATRSSCLRRQVGAVLVKNRQILATGYNGVPRGLRHCEERGCLRDELGIPSGERHELCRGLHAEQNAIIQAAYHGVPIRGAELYCTHQPCAVCAKMLVNADIVAVYFCGRLPRHAGHGGLRGGGHSPGAERDRSPLLGSRECIFRYHFGI